MFWSENDIYLPPLSKIIFFSPLQHVFLYSYCALFALILPYFASI
jgi:hypothetical protein